MIVGSQSSFIPIRRRFWNTAETSGFSSIRLVSFSMSDFPRSHPDFGGPPALVGTERFLELGNHPVQNFGGRCALRKMVSLGEQIALQVGGFGVQESDLGGYGEGGGEGFLCSERGRNKNRESLDPGEAFGDRHRIEVDFSLQKRLQGIPGSKAQTQSVFPRPDVPGLIKEFVKKNKGRGFSQETAGFEPFAHGPDALSLFDLEQDDSGAGGCRGAALPNEPSPAPEEPGRRRRPL
jgi:hypothetical protein